MSNPWDKWREISPPTKRLNNKGEWEAIPGKESREERYKRELQELYKKNDDTPEEINSKKLLRGNTNYYNKVNYRLTPKQRELYARRKKWEKDNEKERWVGRELVKPLFTGATSALDIPVAAWNAGTWLGNKASGGNMPYAEYPSELVGQGVDKLTNSFSDGRTESIAGKAIEFGSSMYGGGMLVKGLKSVAPASKAVNKIAPWLGSTKGGDVASAAGMGAVTQGAEDLGANPIAAAGIGLVAAPTISGMMKRSLDKSAGKFNMKAYDAAQRENINLPRYSFDKSTKTKFAHTVAEHSLLSGEGLTTQQYNTNASLRNALENILNTTSVKKTFENQTIMKDLYRKSRNALTSKDVTTPTATLESLPKARSEIQEAVFMVDLKEKDALTMFRKLKKSILEMNIGKKAETTAASFDAYTPIEKNVSVPVSKLIEQKVRINKQIKSLSKDSSEWVLREALKVVRNGINQDITTYAKSNPTFQKNWEAAETLYAKMTKRVKQYKELGLNDIVNPAVYTDPRAIANNYLKVKNNSDFIELIGGVRNRRRFDDLVTAVEALPVTKVSALAKNMKIMSALATGTTILLGGGSFGAGAIAGGTAYVGVDLLAHRMISKGKSFEKLVAYAKKQTSENAKKAKNTIEKEAGMPIIELNGKLEQLLHKINSVQEVNKAKTTIATTNTTKKLDEEKQR